MLLWNLKLTMPTIIKFNSSLQLQDLNGVTLCYGHLLGYPIEHQVADCDNDTTIPYGDDQPFSQSSPIKSNPFFSSWTGPPTLPSSITPVRPSIIHRPIIPSTLSKIPTSVAGNSRLQSPQHFDALYPSLTTTATTAIATAETSALTTTSSVTTTATSGTGAGAGQTTLPSINSSGIMDIHAATEKLIETVRERTEVSFNCVECQRRMYILHRKENALKRKGLF
ncbi:unnamed protein product [Mytilus edulis]|uniref:Uncharacterized protein n=1 Tax=Mytilus edulis TaxID=6550 RepID=A0A8S3REW7_MYTED|nr:unnamed protein product [Mytilus edulis]